MSGKSLLFAAALAAVCAAATTAAAQSSCKLQKITELPVRMPGLRPEITVQVNGKDSRLLVDTGVFETVVSRPSAERDGLHITPVPMRYEFHGVGGEERDVGTATAKDFSFAGAELHDVPLMVMGHAGGRDLDGNVGLNLLAFADLEIDLANKVIRFFRPEGCRGGTAYWADQNHLNWLDIAPIAHDTQHIRGEAVVNGQKIRVIFDTGATRSGLSRQAAEKIGFKVDGAGVQPGGGVRGFGPDRIQSWIMPVSVFSMGGEEIHNTRLRVFDHDWKDYDMVVGADFFLAHRVYVAPKDHHLFFTYNGSGPVFLLDRAPPSEVEAPPAQ